MRIALALGPFILLALASSLAAAADGERSLDELRAALRFQLSSFRSISAKYELSYQPNDKDGAGRPWGPDSHDWAESHDRKLLIAFATERQRTPQNFLQSFDGAKAYYYSWAGNSPNPGTLKISKALDRYSSAITPNRLLGRTIAVLDCSVLDIVDDPAASLAGKEAIDGQEYWRVNLDGVATATTRATVSVYLDPQHDYLPKRISIDRTIKGRDYRMSCEVDEFSRVSDKETSSDRWFPIQGTLYQPHGRHMLSISEILVNVALEDDRFRPTVPDGTRVYDWTTGEEVASIAGGRRARDEIAKKRAEDAKRELANKKDALAKARDEGAPLDVSAQNGWWGSRATFYASIGLITAGLLIGLVRFFKSAAVR